MKAVLVPLASHAIAIVHGAGASTVCFVLLWLGGLSILSLAPRRAWASGASEPDPVDPVDADNALPAVLCAAVLAVTCWYGVQRGFGLTRLFEASGIALLVLLVVRGRHVWRFLQAGDVWRSTLRWCGAFALFYAVAYLFAAPDVSGQGLPIATFPNNDVLNYLNYARALQDHAPSNVAGLSFFTSPGYLQTPAVYPGIALLATFFRNDPLHAMMPMQFTFSALIALLAAYAARTMFSVSRPWALAIGAALISGPFYRYVAGNYFLSSLMGVAILMNLLWTTIAKVRGRAFDPSLVTRFAAHYVLLVLLYPVLLCIALVVQAAVAGASLLVAVSARDPHVPMWRQLSAPLVRIGLGIVLGLACMTAVLPNYVVSAAHLILYLSYNGAGGWALNMISPRALMGFPGPSYEIQTAFGDEHRAMLWLGAAMLVLVCATFWWFRRRTSVAERLSVAVCASSLLVYFVAFNRFGYSYQQWKLASCLPLPLSCLTFAALVRLGRLAVSQAPQTERRPGVLRLVLPVAFAVCFVGGNLLAYAKLEARPRTFPAALANLRQVDGIRTFRDLYVEMADYGNTFLSVYFIRSKQLHLVSESYYPKESLEIDRVSPTRPYLLQGPGCEGVGHSQATTIDGVGCLMLAPPAPDLHTVYPFSKDVLFMKPVAGIGKLEGAGRWNAERSAEWRLSVDDQRVPTTEALYVNLHLTPYLSPRTATQAVSFAWGARQASTTLAMSGWVALRVNPSDWDGARIKTLIIKLQMPGGLAPAEADPPSDDQRPLAIQFRELAIDTAPKGTVLGAGG